MLTRSTEYATNSQGNANGPRRANGTRLGDSVANEMVATTVDGNTCATITSALSQILDVFLQGGRCAPLTVTQNPLGEVRDIRWFPRAEHRAL